MKMPRLGNLNGQRVKKKGPRGLTSIDCLDASRLITVARSIRRSGNDPLADEKILERVVSGSRARRRPARCKRFRFGSPGGFGRRRGAADHSRIFHQDQAGTTATGTTKQLSTDVQRNVHQPSNNLEHSGDQTVFRRVAATDAGPILLQRNKKLTRVRAIELIFNVDTQTSHRRRDRQEERE